MSIVARRANDFKHSPWEPRRFLALAIIAPASSHLDGQSDGQTGGDQRRMTKGGENPKSSPPLVVLDVGPILMGSSGNPNIGSKFMACKRSTVRDRYPPPT
jgi:hypothetical protein